MKKQILVILLLASLLVSCLALTACARYSEGLYFSYDDRPDCVVTGIGDCKDTNIVIPKTHNKEPVTAIASDAFKGTNIESVVIPEGVTSIGREAFSGCASLTSVTLPSSLTDIESGAFSYCTSLTSIVIPDGVEIIRDDTFYGCESLTSVTIPSSVKTIGDSAFCNCTSLTSIAIPNGVTDVKDSTFSGCTNLTSVEIPNSVRFVRFHTFYNCTKLESVTIPASVKSVETSAFDGCASLTSINVDANNEKYQSIDGNLYSKDGKTLYRYAIGKSDASFAIPAGVTTVDSYAFSYCANLTSITISSSVTEIYNRCFDGCANIVNFIVDGDNLKFKTIDGNLYSKDGELLIKYAQGKTANSFAVPNGVLYIEQYAFLNCVNLESVTISASVKCIESSAFAGCTGLTSVVFEDPYGWKRNQSWSDTSGLSATFTDPAKNALWLTDDYVDFYMHKTSN